MKVFKIIIFTILGIALAYCAYAMIGHLILGLNTPKLIGGKETIFTGQYIMSGMYLFFSLILTTTIILLAKKLKNKTR